MSTAGKVLVVLLALVLSVAIVVSAGVAQLNTNANKRLDELKADIAKLKEDVVTTQASAEDTLLKVNDEHVGKERDMRLVRIRLSTAERQVSTTRESLSRLLIQVDNAKKAVATAQQGLTQRNEEKAKFEKDKADEEAVVKRLQEGNSDLTAQLLRLRSDFQKALQTNQDEVRKQLNGTKPYVRSATFIR